LQAANADLGAARATLFPSIQLTAQLGAQSLALGSLVSNPATSWNLAAGLVQPIFQGGRLRAQVDVTEARQEELLVDYRRTLLTALGEVDTALGAVQQAEQRYAFLLTASELAEQAFRLAEARYREGSITLQTLLDTQRTWYGSLDSLTQQRATWLLASIDLYRALGGGWQAPTGA
jgi:outer membrane protein TolC